MKYQLCDYVEALYKATSFDEAFAEFQKAVFQLGFDGVLYTYIPRPLINSKFCARPVYKVSEGYSPDYLSHYADARFDKYDPLIRAVEGGVQRPIDWWGDLCDAYKRDEKSSQEVMEVSRSYGIKNGVTLPLLSGERGLAGASCISHDPKVSALFFSETLDALTLRAKLFHTLVMSDACYKDEFVRPLVSAFSQTQLRYMSGLADGKSTGVIASELGTTSRYLEKSMLGLRRKLSGVGDDGTATVTRNQVIYYAGLLNILENEMIDKDFRTRRQLNTARQ